MFLLQTKTFIALIETHAFCIIAYIAHMMWYAYTRGKYLYLFNAVSCACGGTRFISHIPHMLQHLLSVPMHKRISCNFSAVKFLILRNSTEQAGTTWNFARAI